MRFEGVFDGMFDGDDVAGLSLVHLVDEGSHGGGFAAASGAADENQAVWEGG